MSDDQSPPDLTATAEFPRDEFSETSSTPPAEQAATESEGGRTTLFAHARPLGLAGPKQEPPDAGSVLEGAARPFTGRLAPAETMGRFKTFLASGKDHAEPLYRRQGTLAALGLGVLALTVVFSLPRTRTGSGSEVVVETADDTQPAAIAANRHDGGSIDAVGSERLFRGSNTEEALADADRREYFQPPRTEVNQPASTATTASNTEPSVGQLPTLAELTETSVVVGPDTSACQDGGPGAPGCDSVPIPDPTVPDPTASTSTDEVPTSKGGGQSSTSAPSSTGGGESSTTMPAETTTTEAETTTTRRKTTTTRRRTTTTTRPATTSTTRPETTTTAKPKTTTTRPTTSTTRPATTTTRPATTTTSRPTTTTQPASQSPDPPPSFVQCTPESGSNQPINPAEPGIVLPSGPPCPE